MLKGDGGGVTARRALLRWALRSFRREWRQQVLVLGMLVASIAAAIGFATATYNTVGVPENAEFGSANHRYIIDDTQFATVASAVDAAFDDFGVVDIIGEWKAAVPGSVESVRYRSQDPAGAYSHPMLAKLEGRYPTAADEAAVTDGVAAMLQASIGDQIALDGRARTVVGVVENPSDLDEEFALVAPSQLDDAESFTLLIEGVGGFDEVVAIRAFGAKNLPGAELTTREDLIPIKAAAAVVGVAVVVLVLVSLVASAGFVAVAQRRLRQLGMLSAVGATQRHLRLVVVANGALIGLVAVVLGGVLGIAAWFVAAPGMESAAGFRIDRWNLPWVMIAATTFAALTTTTAAAWWPARSVAAVPTTHALSGRPTSPRPAHRSATVGAVLTIASISLLVAADGNVAAVGIGTIGAVAGVLALSPLAIAALARLAGRFPVAIRLAWRDLSRHRARSGLALAAVSLALGIPVAVAVAANAADATAPPGNLRDDQLLMWTRDPAQPEGISPFYTTDPDDSGLSPYMPNLTTADIIDANDAVEAEAAAQGWTVTALEVVLDPEAQGDSVGPLAVTIARQTDLGKVDVALVYRANPQLLELYGLDTLDGIATTGPKGPNGIVTDTERLWFANLATPPAPLEGSVKLTPSYSSLPGTFIGDPEIAGRGWSIATVGWLVNAPAPITVAQIAELRNVAVASGLLIEGQEQRSTLTALRFGATGAGAFVALAVLAMTVGLIRAESARDTRLLAATGASSTIRRTLTASTAGGLAALGALVGTTCAYIVVGAGYVDDRNGLKAIPAGSLLAVIVVVPLAASAAGWIAAGRSPTGIALQPIE